MQSETSPALGLLSSFPTRVTAADVKPQCGHTLLISCSVTATLSLRHAENRSRFSPELRAQIDYGRPRGVKSGGANRLSPSRRLTVLNPGADTRNTSPAPMPAAGFLCLGAVAPGKGEAFADKEFAEVGVCATVAQTQPRQGAPIPILRTNRSAFTGAANGGDTIVHDIQKRLERLESTQTRGGR
jgi:hypothetical protein